VASIQVSVNGKLLASVSDDGLNIISVHVHGDVIGEEIAAVEVFGGNYGKDEADQHLIWVNDHAISTNDEIEIAFGEHVSTSHAGKTIEELHPGASEPEGSGQPMDELFEELATRQKLREKFMFELVSPDGDAVSTMTGPDDFSFHFSVMWKWTKPDESKAWLTSNTLEKIAKQEDGSKHAAFALRFGQNVKLRVGT